MNSERPEGLSPLEMEQYELAIEEQAYPFEEQAISVHENNLKLITLGVYNVWIDKSLQKLAEFVPARYDKPEEASAIISSLDTYQFEIYRPEAQSEVAEPAAVVEPQSEVVEPTTEVEPQSEVGEPAAAVEPQSEEPAPAADPAGQPGADPIAPADAAVQ